MIGSRENVQKEDANPKMKRRTKMILVDPCEIQTETETETNEGENIQAYGSLVGHVKRIKREA